MLAVGLAQKPGVKVEHLGAGVRDPRAGLPENVPPGGQRKRWYMGERPEVWKPGLGGPPWGYENESGSLDPGLPDHLVENREGGKGVSEEAGPGDRKGVDCIRLRIVDGGDINWKAMIEPGGKEVDHGPEPMFPHRRQDVPVEGPLRVKDRLGAAERVGKDVVLPRNVSGSEGDPMRVTPAEESLGPEGEADRACPPPFVHVTGYRGVVREKENKPVHDLRLEVEKG